MTRGMRLTLLMLLMGGVIIGMLQCAKQSASKRSRSQGASLPVAGAIGNASPAPTVDEAPAAEDAADAGAASPANSTANGPAR